jgi:translation initiation factor 1
MDITALKNLDLSQLPIGESLAETPLNALPEKAVRQDLRVWLERQKGGKVTTIIKGWQGNDADILAIAKLLKLKCGVGGAAKNGEILLQGDVRKKAVELLTTEGHIAKQAGG